MGGSASTPKPPTDQQVVAQIGYTNTATVVQNLEIHMSKASWFLAVIIVLMLLGGIIYIIKKADRCMKKQIDRRARAIVLKERVENV